MGIGQGSFGNEIPPDGAVDPSDSDPRSPSSVPSPPDGFHAAASRWPMARIPSKQPHALAAFLFCTIPRHPAAIPPRGYDSERVSGWCRCAQTRSGRPPGVGRGPRRGKSGAERQLNKRMSRLFDQTDAPLARPRSLERARCKHARSLCAPTDS